MKPKFFVYLILLVAGFFLSFCGPAGSDQKVSGTLQNGFRILEIRPDSGVQTFTVYRGDYIKFKLPRDLRDPVARFSLSNRAKPLDPDLEKTSYFKMKTPGVHPFTIGSIKGEIRVIEYIQANYRELTAEQAHEFIRSHGPLVLDVRTPGEYKRGHLKDALLIPVQSLQKRIRELEDHKGKPVLIYCATGNRSTVASKILIDKGFSDILNLKRGIAAWAQKQYPIVK
ncbi:rhodanese-like domain-containing protein [Desulfospira joergensenii]|uniref:rhodanese-like domain-containing protein n=1 Tax=Desulfospira joergensenii TaxID=53329 RepID=UPI0003B5870F|nr:rhodanese-like domain-containing protein [Desulfospira joergensenii]